MAMQFNAVLEPDVAVTERSELRSDIAAGVTEIPVKNASKFAGNKYLCLGQFGEETAELIKIDSINEAMSGFGFHEGKLTARTVISSGTITANQKLSRNELSKMRDTLEEKYNEIRPDWDVSITWD